MRTHRLMAMLIAVATLALAFATTAQSKIVYTPVNDRLRRTIDFDGAAPYELGFHVESENLFCDNGEGHYWDVQVFGFPHSDNGVVSFRGSAGALPAGTLIGPSLNFSGSYVELASLVWGDCGVYHGLWTNLVDRYLGVRFHVLRNGVVETHYGWVKLTVSAHLDNGQLSDGEVFVSGFAYETEDGVPIVAGAVS